MKAAQAAGGEERRIDPEDGQARTFEELRKLCQGSYSEQEIREYWDSACRSVPLGTATASSAPSAMHSARAGGSALPSARLSARLGSAQPSARNWPEEGRSLAGIQESSAAPPPAPMQPEEVAAPDETPMSRVASLQAQPLFPSVQFPSEYPSMQLPPQQFPSGLQRSLQSSQPPQAPPPLQPQMMPVPMPAQPLQAQQLQQLQQLQQSLRSQQLPQQVAAPQHQPQPVAPSPPGESPRVEGEGCVFGGPGERSVSPLQPLQPAYTPNGNNPFAGGSNSGGANGGWDLGGGSAPPAAYGSVGQSEAASHSQPPPHCFDEVCDLFGNGAPERKLLVKKILVLVPWFIFVVALGFNVLLKSRDFCWVVSVLLSLVAVCMVLTWWGGRRRSGVSLLTLGVLCLVAALGGTWLGCWGYEHYWRQYWWLLSGRRFGQTDASTPAASRSDAAVLSFWDDRGRNYNQTLLGTAVDSQRAAAYKDGSFYCVAPVLSPGMAGSSLALVNYWAVGIDCCQHLGSFSCDDAREAGTGYAVVMLEGGYPCPGCNNEKFKAAVDAAERMHGLVSAPDALFVRWVRHPSPIIAQTFWQGVFFAVLSLLGGFMLFWLLGSLAWYYGIGQVAGMGNLWHAYRHKHVV